LVVGKITTIIDMVFAVVSAIYNNEMINFLKQSAGNPYNASNALVGVSVF